jgi:hypothetical protein
MTRRSGSRAGSAPALLAAQLPHPVASLRSPQDSTHAPDVHSHCNLSWAPATLGDRERGDIVKRSSILAGALFVLVQGLTGPNLFAEMKYTPNLSDSKATLVLRNDADSGYFHTSSLDVCLGVLSVRFPFRPQDEIIVYIRNNSDHPIRLDPKTIQLSASSVDGTPILPTVEDPVEFYKQRDIMNTLSKYPTFLADLRHPNLMVLVVQDILPGEQLEGFILWNHKRTVQVRSNGPNLVDKEVVVDLKQLEIQLTLDGVPFAMKFDVTK